MNKIKSFSVAYLIFALAFFASQNAFAQRYRQFWCSNERTDIQTERQCRSLCRDDFSFFMEFEINVERQLVMVRLLQDDQQINFEDLGRCAVIDRNNFQCSQVLNPGNKYRQEIASTLSRGFYYRKIYTESRIDQICAVLEK